MSDYFDYSTGRLTPGTTARSGDLNDTFDELDTGLDKLPTEAQLKNDTTAYDATDAGSANAVVVALPHTAASYVDGMKIVVKVGYTNTGAATINVDSLGVKSIRRQDGTALVAGDLVANKLYEMRYNSTSGYFEIQGSPVGSAGAGTMSTQNASAVAITGGTVAGVTMTTTTLTSPVINTSVSGTAVLDEDTMSSNSATQLATQQSIKAYVDNKHSSHVNNSNGNPNISDTLFDVHTNITEDQWTSNSVGPTGSGADNIWTALDSVASGASWVEITTHASFTEASGTGDTQRYGNVYARKTGGSQAKGEDNQLVLCSAFTSAAGNAVSRDIQTKKIPIDSNGRFDVFWENDFATQVIIYMRLDGYGF